MTASDRDIRQLLTGVKTGDVMSMDVDDPQHFLSLPVNDGIWLVWLILPLALLLFRKNAFWVFVIMALVPLDRPAYAFDWQSLWLNNEQQAYQKFEQGEFEQAGELSTNPQLKGSAWYREQEFEAAVQSFADEDSAKSDYNRGNALVGQQQFEQAIEAYDLALAKNPQFEDARYNKDQVENFLRQQQQTQQNQEQQDSDQDGESQDQPQPSQQESRQQTEAEDKQSPSSERNEQSDQDLSGQPQTKPSEDGENQPSEQELAMREQVEEQGADPEAIDRWLNRLPDDPSELLRRKFLRDYQRQRSQP